MNDTNPARYKYIVVGGGSAGCIVAARLAENGARVLLLEAGDEAREHPETLSANDFKYAYANDATMHHRMSLPVDGMRPKFIGTGRGLGGSGNVNGMVYTRGDKRDFESWPAGWQWDDILPTFQALEDKLGIRTRAPTPFVQRVMEAATGAGFTRKDGMNDGDLCGVIGANTMNFEGDRRRSSYAAWLHDSRPASLDVQCGAKARRILFEGKRATAVEYSQNGQVHQATVESEVILTAGALETPRLLLLSGVGPADELSEAGVSVVQDSPGVGRNLQDHPNAALIYKSPYPVDFSYPQIYAFDYARRPADAPRTEAPDTCFVVFAMGPNMRETLMRMVPASVLPGRLHDNRILKGLLRALVKLLFAIPGLQKNFDKLFSILVILGKPHSRGSIRLHSANPDEPADIDMAFFRDDRDKELIEAGIAKAQSIIAQAPLAGAKPLNPIARPGTGKEALWKAIRGICSTTFHFGGSCRMGNDEQSPLDPELRVKGLDNVRVADASAMPEVPVSALNAPSMMVGYRAADFILAEQKKAEAA